MANKNKVEFGLSNVHYGTYDIVDGEVSLGAATALPGAVELTLEETSESSSFFADDIVYYSDFNSSGETGTLTMALFPDEFKLAILPYIQLEDGGIAKSKTKRAKNIYLSFEGKGDKHKRRHIMYNVALGAISRGYKTLEGSTEVATESIELTVTGDNKTGIVKVTYSEGDSGYESVITQPVVPTIPNEDVPGA